MLENPFLTVPQAKSPQSRSWGQGFAFGFQGPPASILTPADVQTEDADAFQKGVLAGQQSAIDGLEIVPQPCVDLNAVPPSVLEFASPAFELSTVVRETFKRALGGAVVSLVLFLAELSIAGQTHFDDPSEALRASANALRDLLTQMGITDSMELFLGGAVDFDVKGCELKLTPVFRSADAAFSAAQAIGRRGMLVVSWRTDQSGGITLVRFVGS